jgi:hypothetical protein
VFVQSVEETRTHVYSIHANFIVGKDAKHKRMKEFGLWVYDGIVDSDIKCKSRL